MMRKPRVLSFLLYIFFIFAGFISNNLFAQDENKIITEDVKRNLNGKGLEEAQKTEVAKKTWLAKFIIQMINASLYLRGIEGGEKDKPADINLIVTADHIT